MLKHDFDRQTIHAALLVAVGYYFGAKVGFALTFQPHPVSVLWPPNSILLGMLLLRPPREWWVLIAAAFPAHWLAQDQSHVPKIMSLCWFISNCCEALIGAFGVRLFCRVPFRFDSLRNLALFLAFCVFLAPFLSSFIDAGFVHLNHFGTQSYWAVWRMRFFSNVLSDLSIAPAIVTLGTLSLAGLRKLPLRQLIEAACLSVLLVAVSLYVFLALPPTSHLIPTFLYAPLPFLLWATVRFGPRGASAAVLAVALTTIWGAAHGHGPFADKSPEESALSVQLFLIAVSVNLMALGVILEERHRADNELRVAQERYREVVESQTDLVCRYLRDSTLTFANEAFCRFFGRNRDELIGKRFLEFVRSEDRDATREGIGKLVRERQTVVRENAMPSASGKTSWFQWTSYVVTNANGEVEELQAIGHDITDRKRAEEIKQTLAHVSRLAVVGELTAMIAHELNHPLGAILSNADAAEFLLERTNPPLNEIAEIIVDIRKANQRASQAIERIRHFLRKREMEMKPVDLNATVQDVVHLVTGDAMRRHVTLQVQLAAHNPQVLGDRIQLQQVLVNLVLNALDAMQDRPIGEKHLELKTLSLSERLCQISVADSGPGIAPEKLGEVFDSFFTTKQDGMGLGLSIARAIIDAHQGQIWAENNPQKGAVFRINLPVI
jgi:PAS domain S-box-containing protein